MTRPSLASFTMNSALLEATWSSPALTMVSSGTLSARAHCGQILHFGSWRYLKVQYQQNLLGHRVPALPPHPDIEDGGHAMSERVGAMTAACHPLRAALLALALPAMLAACQPDVEAAAPQARPVR